MKKVVGMMVALGVVGGAQSAKAEPRPAKYVSGERRGTPQAKRITEEATPIQRSAKRSAKTRTEAEIARALFKTADANADSTVDRDELVGLLEGYVTKRVHKRFLQLDRNHDGRITRKEVPKMDAGRFARFDLNHDGVFTETELNRVLCVQCSGQVAAVFVRLDADQDGRWTLAELSPKSDEQLEELASH